MEQTILKQIRWLKIYAFTSTGVLALLLITAYSRFDHPQRFEEIDVERINIVEKNGALRMVISNQTRQHPGTVDGQIQPSRQRPAGLLFFNTDGDECGGLIYEGNKGEAEMVLSLDQYKNDQVMQLQYDEELIQSKRVRSYGLRLWDRPDNLTLGQLVRQLDSLKKLRNEVVYQKEIANLKAKHLLGEERLFVGKTRQQETGLFIRDESGNPRIKLYVDSRGKAHLDLLNESGKKLPLH